MARRLLEMGCGTGVHAAELVRAGYNVVGIDLSENMLARARKRADALPLELRGGLTFFQGDARNLRLGQTFEAVIALFHVMSYQNGNRDFLAALETAAQHLVAGGILLFDFWYGPAVLAQGPETRVLEREDDVIRVVRIAEPQLRENENLVEVNYSVLVEEKATGIIKRLAERHVMRYFFLPEIDNYLQQVGLRRVCSKEWMSDKLPSLESWGAMVIAQKT